MEVIVVPHEVGVLLDGDLDVEVTGRATARADLTGTGHADAHAVPDPGGDVDGDVVARAHATVAGALLTRVGDDLAGPLAPLTGPGDLHPAEDGLLHLHDLALPLTGRAGHRGGLALRAGPLADVAEHGGIDGHLALHTGEALLECDVEAEQRIVARADPGHPRPAGAGTTAAEEGVEDVPETTAAEAAAGTATAETGILRVAARVDDTTLLRVGEHLLCQGRLAELLRGFLGRVHIGVVLAGEAPVRLLDLGIGGVLVPAEDAVVVTSQGYLLPYTIKRSHCRPDHTTPRRGSC